MPTVIRPAPTSTPKPRWKQILDAHRANTAAKAEQRLKAAAEKERQENE